MRKTCTKSDALEVIEIMRSSMVDTFDNELGLLDVSISRSQVVSSGNSKSAQIKDFVGILQAVSEKKKSLLFSLEDIKEIYQVERFEMFSFEFEQLDINFLFFNRNPILK